MARGREQAVVDVEINNAEAKKRAAELTAEFDELSRKKREALRGGDLGLAAALDKECKVIRKDLRQYRQDVGDVDRVLRSLNKVSLNDLQKAHRAASRDLQRLGTDAEGYHAALVKVRQLEGEISRRRPASGGLNNRMMGMLGGTAIVAGLERLASRAVKVYEQLDDKMADVMKTTGLTKDEVVALDKVLQQIDTRTSREELLDLARVAGQLGIEGAENIAGFVRAADQISVALSEDLGGNVEDSIRQIGKLTDIFHLQEDLGIEKSFLAVGSAINSLGASSTAKEDYLVEFTKRVAGTAPAMGVSIQQALGLGATLDQLGQTAEVSATTYGQVMTKMRKDTDTFARIAGMSVKDFTQLMEKDANEAFIRFLEGLGSASMTDRVKMLGTLKLEGQRATQVLGVLADNTALLRDQQALSNTEFAKATSLTEEYNTKNESAAAIAEKRRKNMQQAAAEMGEKLFPIWSQALGLGGNLMRALGAILGVVAKYSGVIITLTAAIVAYNVVKRLQVFWSAAHRAEMVAELSTMTAATAGTKLLAAAKLLLVGNLRAAGAAFKMFWTSIGPVGWAVTAIAGLASVLGIVKANTNSATSAQRTYNDVKKRAGEIEDEHGVNLVGKAEKLRQLMRVVEAETTSENRRAEAIGELQRLMPDGIELINQETIASGKAAAAVKAHTDQLILQATIKAALQKKEELIEKAGKDKLEGKDAKVSLFGRMLFSGAAAESGGTMDYDAMVAAQSEANRSRYQEKLDEEIGEIDKIIEDARKQLEEKKLIVPIPTLEDDDLDDDPDTGGTGGSKDNKWRLEQDEKFMTEKIALRKRLAAGEIETEDDYNKQLLALEVAALERRLATDADKGAERQALQADLADKQYKLQKTERDRLEALIAASLEGQDGSEYDRLVAGEKNAYEKRLQDLGLFGKAREDMTAAELAAIENLERNHTAKLQRIYMDQLEREFKAKQADTQRSANLLKIERNEQLAGANTFAKKRALIQQLMGADMARQARTDKQADRILKEYYNRIESEEAERHLEGLLKHYQAYMAEARKITEDGSPMLNDAEIIRLQEIIDELQKQLADIRTVEPTEGPESNVDILGFTEDKWEQFFEHLDTGKMKIEDWQLAIAVVGQAFSAVSELMSAAENREFKNYEKSQQKKKKSLDARLKSGQISEAQHAQMIEQIDEELDRKKAELERKQATREKALKIFEAITNTAVSITAALKAGPIIGPILAAVVGALGAVQIAAIATAPLPGAEDGGYLDVTRAQDGKRFRAKQDPNARGYVGPTSVIVSENGEEYVATAAAVRNPTIRPVLDLIDVATRNGTVGSINLPEIMNASIPGRAGGGYIGTPPAKTYPPRMDLPNDEGHDVEAYLRILATLDRLDKRFERPLKADTHLIGRGGIKTAEDQYKKIRRRL